MAKTLAAAAPEVVAPEPSARHKKPTDAPKQPTEEPLRSPALAALIGYNARRVSLLMIGSFVHQAAPFGLRPVEFSVLSLIHHNPGATSRQLCQSLGLRPPNLVGMLDALVARQLVERRPHPRDRRAQALHASAQGTQLAQAAEARVRAGEDAATAHLTARERATLVRLLAKLHQKR